MRDTRKPVNYLQDYFVYQTEDIIETIEYLSSGNVNNPNRMLVAIFNSKVRQLVVAYSLGKNKEELTDLYMEFLDINNQYKLDYDYMYIESIWLLSFAICLEIEAEKLIPLKNKILEKEYNDFLMSILLRQLFDDINILDSFFMKKPYPILESIIKLGVTANIEDLKTYLEKDWYKAHNGLAWHNTHKKDHSYLGYWAFETAAIVKIFGLDDSSLRDVDYYPYDLVHFGDEVT